MPRWTIEYTLPGERGKLHKKSGDGNESLRKAIADIEKKGGKVKVTDTSYGSEKRIIPPSR
jgi:hypothetical protein